MDMLIHYWWALAIALAAVLLLLFLLVRPRQTVRLTSDAPVRPHMAAPLARTLTETEGAVDHMQKVMGSPVHTSPPAATDKADDLTALKGVGPKLADLLHAHGIHRFDEIAKLGPGQIQALDEALGAFRGRLVRDRIIEQADYLARGDIDGFEAKFGKL